MVPLVASPGAPALMAAADSEPGYRALIPPDLDFDDAVAARFLLRVGLYRPGRSAARVKCPILFCICDKDTIAPAAPALKYASQAPKAEVKRYPVHHFEIYTGEPFETAVADQLEFLTRVLG
jgi:fermentation-respiration switch protein FrsA (DUF1100 family)